MRNHLLLIALAGFLVGATACSEPSPELRRLCEEYVEHQERLGKTSPNTARTRCLRMTPKQVRCIMSATGRTERIACTQ